MMRDRNGRFVKGISGNPQGRPKGTAIDGILKDYMRQCEPGADQSRNEDICRVLYKTAMAGDVQAMKLIFERVDGKPNQKMEIAGPDGGPLQIMRWTEGVEVGRADRRKVV